MSKLTASRGSILIWTLLLGLSLATVFFFFSQRLNAGAASQRETIEYQNARLFFESYIAYLQNLSAADLIALRDDDGGKIDFEGITGTLTNEADEITGVVDAGGTSGEYHFDDEVNIDWNSCANNFKTDLVVGDGTDTIFPHVNNSCPSGGYDDTKVVDVHDPFKLKSNGAPFAYKIYSTTPDQPVFDNKWQIDLELSLGFRKKLTTSLTFTPSS